MLTFLIDAIVAGCVAYSIEKLIRYSFRYYRNMNRNGEEELLMDNTEFIRKITPLKTEDEVIIISQKDESPKLFKFSKYIYNNYGYPSNQTN